MKMYKHLIKNLILNWNVPWMSLNYELRVEDML